MSTPVGRSLVMPYNITVGAFLRTHDDALRSLSRYMALALGSEWEVRRTGEEHTFRTPFARVEWAGPAQMGGRPNWIDVLRPAVVYCYPDYPEGCSIEEAAMIADATEELLVQAFSVGVGNGYPERVPFYNYSNVPLDGSGSNARGPSDYMRIARGSLSIERITDPTDERWITVLANLRLTWLRPGRQLAGKPVESISTEFVTVEV